MSNFVQLSNKKQKVSCCSLTANRLLFVFTIALELPHVNGNRLLLMITGSIARNASDRFRYVRGRFRGLSPHRGDTLHWWRMILALRSPTLPRQISPHRCMGGGVGQKRKNYNILNKFWNTFTVAQNTQSVTQTRKWLARIFRHSRIMESFTMNGFTDHLVKFGDIRRQGSRVVGVWNWGDSVTQTRKWLTLVDAMDASIPATAACSCTLSMTTRWASLCSDRHSSPATAHSKLRFTTL